MNIKNEQADKYSESAMVNIKNEHADRNSVNSECFLSKHWPKSLTVIITHTNKCPAHRFSHQPARIPGAGRRPDRPAGLEGKMGTRRQPAGVS